MSSTQDADEALATTVSIKLPVSPDEAASMLGTGGDRIPAASGPAYCVGQELLDS